MRNLLFALTSLLALCLACPASAQDTGGGMNPNEPRSTSPAGGMSNSGATTGTTEGGAQSRAGIVSRQDRKFVEDAAEGGMAELEMAQLATQRGHHAAVRDFGSTLVNDHTPANQRLMTLAATLGITPPAEMDFMHRRKVKKLGKAEGRDFDEDFIEAQIKDHKKMVELMEDQAKNGQNADLKQFATDQLPRMREHLQTAQRIEQQLRQRQ